VTYVGHDVVYAPSEPCFATVTVEVSYVDDHGFAKRHRSVSNSFVTLQNFDVGDEYVATHEIQFENCSTNCFVTFTTQPK